MNDLHIRQLELEDRAYNDGHDRYLYKTKEVQQSKTKDSSTLIHESRLIKKSVAKTADAITVFIDTPASGNATATKLRKLFKAMDTKELAYITIKNCFNVVTLAGHGHRSLQDQCIHLGKHIEAHLNFKKFVSSMPGYAHVVEQKLAASTQTHRHRVISNIIRAKKADIVKPIKWDEALRLVVGQKLTEIFVRTCGLFNKGLLYRSATTTTGNKKVLYTLRMNDKTRAWLEDNHMDTAEFRAFKQPMVVPPKDWSTPYNGGYLTNDGKTLLKMKSDKRNREINKRLASENPESVYSGINAIQSTPWIINMKILEVMQTFKNGGIAGIPDRDIKLLLPPKPWASDAEHDELQKTDPDRVLTWKKKSSEIHDAYHRETSKRTAFLGQLSIAQNFKDYKEIYFPVNCDWRMRNYPEPWFVNPQGDDIGRGLLKFKKSKLILGNTRGSHWLMVHAANCYGEDKCSFVERVKWVYTNQHNIEACAREPYDNLWWTEADKPFQFLAVCFELAELWSTGNVMTHLPVQMDGTCNGLQNFSMIMRDEIGGAAVNLTNHHKPADIYTQVMNETIALVNRDSLNVKLDGNTRGYARAWLQAGIDRKIVKRNVMTLPYGASLFGFSEQLIAEVKKRNRPGNPYLPDDIMFNCCRYLAKINREAISRVVVKSVECMSWMQEITRLIAKEGHTIKWTTPLKATVEQQNMKQYLKRVSTYWGGVRIQLGLQKDTDELAGQKMANGIAPNFIHSMDASHLLLTTLAMKAQGITEFSMIHDSYGTLATDVDIMHICIRESFVQMYGRENLLKKFFDDITKDLPEELVDTLPGPPKLGNLVASEVLDADYFFA